MDTHKRLIKIIIIVILAIFLTSTVLVSVMYLAGSGNKNSQATTGDNLGISGAVDANQATGD